MGIKTDFGEKAMPSYVMLLFFGAHRDRMWEKVSGFVQVGYNIDAY